MLTCSSSMALYHQPTQALLGGIITGELSPQDHLPPQRELTVAYRVSRDTGRNTITDLKDKSYIRREESKSTVFAPSRIQHGILTLTSLSTDIRARRMTPGSERLTLRREPAQARIARVLSLNEGDEVWFVERLRFADSDVVSLNLSYLSLPQDVTLTEDDLRQEVSLWKLLADKGILFSESAKDQYHGRRGLAREVSGPGSRGTATAGRGCGLLQSGPTGPVPSDHHQNGSLPVSH